MKRSSYDFTILGGGPAGSACALLLYKLGARVLLIERFGFKRYRPGEHLAPAVLGALAALDTPAADLRNWVEASPGIVSRWAFETPIYRPYRGRDEPGPGMNVSRTAFDQYLFKYVCHSGVDGRIGPRLVGSERVGSEWQLDFVDTSLSVRSSFVLDASGRSAVFAHQQGAVRQAFDDLVAIAVYFPAGFTANYEGRNLVVEAVENGWWSITFTAKGALVATFFSSATDRRQSGLSTRQWWERGLKASRLVRDIVGVAMPAQATELVSAAFPTLLVPAYGQGWLAVGDAAATYDPLCGHGVVHALESAFLAADVMGRAPDSAHVQALYAEAIQQKMAEHLNKRIGTYHEAAYRFDSPYWRYYQSA